MNYEVSFWLQINSRCYLPILRSSSDLKIWSRLFLTRFYGHFCSSFIIQLTPLILLLVMYLSQQRWWYRISAANGSGVASISLRMRSLMSMSSSNTVCCLNTFQAFSWFRRYKVFNFRPGCFLSSGRMHQTHKFLSCRCPLLKHRRFGEGAGRGSAAAGFRVSDADVDSLHTQEKNNKVLS